MATKYSSMATRAVALEWALYFAEVLKVRERGRNTGTLVRMFQLADGLAGEGYSWCQSFLNGCWRLATGARIKNYRIVGGTMLAAGTASVGQFAADARRHGHVVKRPYRADYFCMQLTGDNWPDHVGQIVRVLRLWPGAYWCKTVEGNTGSESVDDGDGAYVKHRFLRSSRTIFVRKPGLVLNPHLPPKRVKA